MDIEKLRFPIGDWENPKDPSEQDFINWRSIIEELPERVEQLTKGLNEDQLQWIYRPGGWSMKQVVHHLADSHMNSFIRYKLTLTEDHPTIRPYMESKWAEMADHSQVDISVSIDILRGVHKRWSVLLASLKGDDLERKYYHPESKRDFSIVECTSMYAWHCEHHLAHLLQALESKGRYSLVENL